MMHPPTTGGGLSKAAAVLLFLLPSFVSQPFQRRVLRAKTAQASEPLNATSYLDGLRGVAALIVYVFHYTYLWYGRLGNGYGASEDDLWFVQRPLVRIFHSGRASVTTFFVISGFVLTVRPLTLLHRGQHDRLFDALGGALFRRPLRLYLPITASTAIIAVLGQLNLFGRPYVPTVANNPSDQLRHWLGSLVVLWNPFRLIKTGRAEIYQNPYDPHLWTIPVEFKGSLLVFLLLLAFLRVRAWIRLAAILTTAVWLVNLVDFDMALFAGGLFFAELSIILPPARPHGGPPPTGRLSRLLALAARPERHGRLLHLARHAATLGAFLAALWLLSCPTTNVDKSHGYRALAGMTPARYAGGDESKNFFWLGCGSLLLFAALMYSPPCSLPAGGDPYSAQAASLLGQPAFAAAASRDGGPAFDAAAQPMLQRPFTTRFAQYLGTHSYSLYLAHASVNVVVGRRLLGAANAAFSQAEAQSKALAAQGNRAAEAEALMDDAQWGFWRAFLFSTLLNTFVLFWVSDVFTRAVDVHCVKLGRRFQRWAWARS